MDHTPTQERKRQEITVIRYPPQLQYKKLQTNTTHTKVYNIIISNILKEKGKKYIFIINNYNYFMSHITRWTSCTFTINLHVLTCHHR
jgi:hypothetical protein